MEYVIFVLEKIGKIVNALKEITLIKMKCPKCKKEMDYEDGIHRWNIRYWECECGFTVDEDITGDLIDYAKETREL